MGKIVIVDDSRLARMYTASCLRKEGHEVHEVEPTSIFEVAKALLELQPDLLIMDFLMPHCPGTSLARICHEDPQLQQLRMLVLTAHRDEIITARLKHLGVSQVLFKPVEPGELQDAVAALLAQPNPS